MPETRETVVRLIKNWSWPNLARQTPKGGLRWGNVRFVEDDVPCDYAVVLNFAPPGTAVTCPPENVWLLLQEPPNEHFRPMHAGGAEYTRIFTTDEALQGPRYVHEQPALPWHVERDYDWLKACAPPEKVRSASCITSAKAIFEGHRRRLRFLADVRRQMEFDLFGRGFASVSDKWDVLAPYRYAIVVENFANAFYWSEKLSDCLLAWTVPIYVGCTNIGHWFPDDAVVSVDMNDPNVVDKIRAVVAEPQGWDRRRAALAEARNRILDRYNLFPFLADEIARNAKKASAPTRIQFSKAA